MERPFTFFKILWMSWGAGFLNEGVAFRYVSPQDAGSALELTTFNFAGDYTAWFYNGERHNIGPERLTETDGERLPVDDGESCG